MKRVIAIIGLILLLGLIGCAGISLKLEEPTAQKLMNIAAYEAGFTIGQGNRAMAEEFIQYTQVDREDILTLYPSWKRYLSFKLTDNPRYRHLVGEVLGLVNIQLRMKMDKPLEQEKIIRELFQAFVSGLRAGIDAEVT